MSPFTNDQLYSCIADNREPDWTDFIHLEIGGCINAPSAPDDGIFVIGGLSDAEAQFWCVYGRMADGDCEAITDCATRSLVDAVASELSTISGLSIGGD